MKKSKIVKTRLNSILILNGSPAGSQGNGAEFLKAYWPSHIPQQTIYLNEIALDKKLAQKILRAPAVVFVTGTYWDSWGSPLQRFLEWFTSFEGHREIIGKPVACVVLMHSVGGKSILSRLQGVLNTFGFLIPPMSGMVYSLVNQLSHRVGSSQKNSHADDFWQPSDLSAIVENLVVATELTKRAAWQRWPVDKKNPQRIWLKNC